MFNALDVLDKSRICDMCMSEHKKTRELAKLKARAYWLYTLYISKRGHTCSINCKKIEPMYAYNLCLVSAAIFLHPAILLAIKACGLLGVHLKGAPTEWLSDSVDYPSISG